MSRYSKTLVISTSLAVMSLSGCSTLSNLFGSDDSYRDSEGKIVQNLEMPPNLFNPAKPKNDIELALQKAGQDTLAQQDTYDHIPNFKADGIAIGSNLSERWLELDSVNSEEIWSGLKRYFMASGFAIEQERKDIGVMKTDYLMRSELVPLDDVGPITKMLNSWRPELADGVYDKFVARLETDTAAGKTRIYFSHNMLYSPDASEARGVDSGWKLKPYNPVMEAQALYQAMVFFGSTSEKALAALKVTENMVEVVDGEELQGLALRANAESSWGYLQAMIYRANWQMDKVRKDTLQMWVQVPKTVQKEDSMLSKMAFWRDSGEKSLPDVIKLQLAPSKTDVDKTLLTIESVEGATPLNAKQRRYVLESLGLLSK